MFVYCNKITAGNEANQLREEATLPIEELLERYGGAGLLVNRALSGMKKGGGSKMLSPVIRAKPSLSVDDDSESSPSQSHEPAAETDSSGTEPVVCEKDKICVNLADSMSNGLCKEDGGDGNASVDAVANNDSGSLVDTGDVAASSLRENGSTSAVGCDSSTVENESESNSNVMESCTSGSASCNEAGGNCVDNEPGSSSSTSEVCI